MPDASVDAVFVSSAWHWLDRAVAVPEIARVLRDGGRLGVIWTSRDRRTDWVAQLDVWRRWMLTSFYRGRRGRAAGAAPRRRPREVTLPDDAPFVNLASASFTTTRSMTVDDAVDWLGTYSGLITAPAVERAAALASSREALLRRADGNGMVEIPMRAACWRADRGPRPWP